MGLKSEIDSSLDPYFLSEDDFAFFSGLIFRLAGISLSLKKRDLLVARLKTHLQKNGLGSITEYRCFLEKTSVDDPNKQTFINILTTNKTSFFREPQHFQYLQDHLVPAWIEQKKSSVHIWNAASSSGEEPYSTAMVLNRFLPPSIKVEMVASDIDSKVLNTARNGVYSLDKLADIPFEYRALYTTRGRDTASGWFKMKDNVRSLISFQSHNLNQSAPIQDETFDLIFCRNVMIYFNESTIHTLVKKLHASLKPKGLLFIGHAEKIQSDPLFDRLQPSVYRKR